MILRPTSRLRKDKLEKGKGGARIRVGMLAELIYSESDLKSSCFARTEHMSLITHPALWWESFPILYPHDHGVDWSTGSGIRSAKRTSSFPATGIYSSPFVQKHFPRNAGIPIPFWYFNPTPINSCDRNRHSPGTAKRYRQSRSQSGLCQSRSQSGLNLESRRVPLSFFAVHANDN